MGMSIDEAIKQLETYTIPCGKYKAAYDLAVDTMRKYQKIVQIVENVDKRYYGYSTMMDYLHEVIEDGKTD